MCEKAFLSKDSQSDCMYVTFNNTYTCFKKITSIMLYITYILIIYICDLYEIYQ